MRGGDCASNDPSEEQLASSSTNDLQRALREVIEEATGEFGNAGIVVHVVEDVILQAVASPAMPSRFTTRFGGAPVALLDDLAPNLAEAARQGQPVFEYDAAIAPITPGVSSTESFENEDAVEWASLATTAVLDDDEVLGFVEIVRTTNDRPGEDEYAFHEDVARRVRLAIASTQD